MKLVKLKNPLAFMKSELPEERARWDLVGFHDFYIYDSDGYGGYSCIEIQGYLKDGRDIGETSDFTIFVEDELIFL